MKKTNKIVIGFVILIITVIYGCEKTEPNVSTADRDKYIGTWDGQSDGPGGHRNFSLAITASNSAPDQIIMNGFDGGTGNTFATVSGNSLSIPSQTVGQDTIAGTGNYSGSSISFNFSVRDGQTVENRTGTASNKH